MEFKYLIYFYFYAHNMTNENTEAAPKRTKHKTITIMHQR